MYPGVAERAHLIRVEFRPSFGVEFVEEWDDVGRLDEVQKSVTDIATVSEVDGQVEKIVLAVETLVDLSVHKDTDRTIQVREPS